jgi:hypothetical protein
MLASAGTGQDLVTGARLSPHDRQVMAALSVVSLGTMILGGAGIGEQEAAVAIWAETELGDLLRVGEEATQGTEDTLRAGGSGRGARGGRGGERGGRRSYAPTISWSAVIVWSTSSRVL